MQTKILAIIPCYNEAGAIGKLLREFQHLNMACDTLVIDDGSSDQTLQIANQFSKTIRFEKNQGVCAGIKKGISYAIENGYEFCIQIDGDGQHIPHEIERLLIAYKESPADIFIGSRYYGRIFSLFGNINRIGGLIISLQIFLLFKRTWLYDSTSGMRMMNRKAMDYFAEYMDESAPDATIVAQAISAGLTIKEFPVKMRMRLCGVSTLSGLRGIYFLIRVIYKIIRIRFTESVPAR